MNIILGVGGGIAFAVLAARDVAHLTIEIHRCELPHDEPRQVAHAPAH